MLVPLLSGTQPATGIIASSASASASAVLADHPDRTWLTAAAAQGARHWVTNVDAAVSSARIGEHDVPVTVLAGVPSVSSYVGSPHAAWISYPYAEALTMVRGWRRPLAVSGLLAVATPIVLLMRLARLDRAAVIGNHLVSTNLHPQWTSAEMGEATPRLAVQFAERPLLLRNVCCGVDGQLISGLTAAGWRLLPARRVYVADPLAPALWKHNHLKRDSKLLNGSDLTLSGPDQITAEDLPALRTLFRTLFIAKHSALNPDYTDAFFALCREQRFLDLYTLRQDGRPVGVLGIYQRHGWVTTPLIGYDTALPQELGIYRRLMALLYREARDRRCQLHLSSGAGSFKSARGGVAHLEYSAVYDRHLGPLRRAAIRRLGDVLDRLVPWALAQEDKARSS